MYPSTLGYFSNSLLQKYQLAFLEKIRKIWENQISMDVPPDDFLLFPDNHALLLASIRPDIQEKKILFRETQKRFFTL